MTKELINDNNPPAFAWVEYDPRGVKDRKALGVYNQQRRIVRSQAAYTSSGTRKATIARKGLLQKSRRQSKTSSSASSPEEQHQQQQRQEHVQQAQDFISSLFARLRSRDATVNTDMAQKADRTLLWNAFTGNNTCFQAALFVAGTFANTCGISKKELHTGLGSGLLFLRGASLDGIQATIVDTPNDCLNSVSIALLAGWERRFGDQRSYEIHMLAWQALPLALGALDVGSIAALADVALESFREASQERYLQELASSVGRSLYHDGYLLAGLPSG
jgi:hypothetical protein